MSEDLTNAESDMQVAKSKLLLTLEHFKIKTAQEEQKHSDVLASQHEVGFVYCVT